jgi:hypothetical protein
MTSPAINPAFDSIPFRTMGMSERLQAHRVAPDDPLMRAVTQAYNAMHALRVHSMYAAIQSGVGKPAEPPD